jgi:uncharacterized membrane protein YkvA (DUF1232 family)
MEKLKSWAIQLKNQILIIYFSIKDPRLNIFVKIFSMLIVGYALSPVDLIPDFIPILGILDDLIILPIGIYFALKMIPEYILNDAKKVIHDRNKKLPRSWKSGLIILIIWIVVIIFSANYIVEFIYG